MYMKIHGYKNYDIVVYMFINGYKGYKSLQVLKIYKLQAYPVYCSAVLCINSSIDCLCPFVITAFVS